MNMTFCSFSPKKIVALFFIAIISSFAQAEHVPDNPEKIIFQPQFIPVITSTPVVSAIENSNYQYLLSASVTDDDSDNLTWSIAEGSELPQGIELLNGYVSTASDDSALISPVGVVIDSAGNIYVADDVNHVILKIDSLGVVTTFAGSGEEGDVDGNGVAASFDSPSDIAIDSADNIYVADSGNHKIRKIDNSGEVTTLAGSGTAGSSDSESPGGVASFYLPAGLTVSSDGIVYVADTSNHIIRTIAQDGTVQTIAGSGDTGSDDGQSTAASFYLPFDVVLDDEGNLYIADTYNSNIRKIDSLGEVTTLAGSTSIGADDGEGTNASFYYPTSLAIHGDSIYVSDLYNHKIRQIDNLGNVTTLAGTDIVGFENGESANAAFRVPRGITTDAEGNIYLADTANNAIRKIEPSWQLQGQPEVDGFFDITLLVSNNGYQNSQSFTLVVQPVNDTPTNIELARDNVDENVDSETEVSSISVVDEENDEFSLSFCGGVDDASFTLSSTDNVYTLLSNTAFDYETKSEYQVCIQAIDNNDADSFFSKNVVIKINNISEFPPVITSTPVTSIDENSDYAYTLTASDADGDELTWAITPGSELPSGISLLNGTVSSYFENTDLDSPTGITFDADGNLYVADFSHHVIRKIDGSGNVTTYGSGVAGNDDGQGISASFSFPSSVAVDDEGNIYVADTANHLIRMIDITGEVSTFAGNGVAGDLDGQDTSAAFSYPTSIAISDSGELYIADRNNHKIRKIDSSGFVSTIAGNGDIGSEDAQGDNASFYYPFSVAVDSNDNLYVADAFNHKIRVVDVFGNVTTLAGSGEDNDTDGQGIEAAFSEPNAVAVDDIGNVYVADTLNHVIRKIDRFGNVTTMVGTGEIGLINGNSDAAAFTAPRGIALDADGNLFVADTYNNTIRKVDLSWQLLGQPDTEGDYAISLTLTSGDDEISHEFTLSVGYINNAPTDIILSAQTIEENSSAGSLIGNLSALDEENDSFNYSFCGGADDNDFSLNVESGITHLSINTVPDFESKSQYNICIKATDDSDNTIDFSKTLLISIENIDEFLPQITSTPVTSAVENDDYHYILAASDGDGDNLTWSSVNSLPSGLSLVNGYVSTLNESFSLSGPSGVAVDSAGNVFIADTANHLIKKIDTSGVLTTFAGSGVQGSDDDQGQAASFYYPSDVAIDSADNLYITDSFNHLIRKIDVNGNVTTYAGSGSAGDVDGEGIEASFYYPSGITVDTSGMVYVADTYNHTIRKIDDGGNVITLAGRGYSGNIDGMGQSAAFSYPFSVAVNSAGVLYVADAYNHSIRTVDTAGDVTTLIDVEAGLNTPQGIAVDNFGTVYISDSYNNRILTVNSDGTVTTLAGTGDAGFADGQSADAVFTSPRGISVDSDGNVYVADIYNNSIRKIVPSWQLIGQPDADGEHDIELVVSDGSSDVSQSFTLIVDAVNDPPTDLTLSDASIDENVVIGTQVGMLLAIDDENDTFSYAFCGGVNDDDFALMIDGGDSYLVTDSTLDFETKAGYQVCIIATDANDSNINISKVLSIFVQNVDEHAPVITSTPVTSVLEDADFYSLLTASDDDNNYLTWSVAEGTELPSGLSLVYQHEVTTLAGDGSYGSDDGQGSLASFYDAIGIATDKNGNTYVADSGNHKIRKIDVLGTVTTFAGSGEAGNVNGESNIASFDTPTDIALDSIGNVYVVDRNNHSIRLIDTTGNVTTFAGNGMAGNVNGQGTAASFYSPSSIAIDNADNIYVVDSNNHKIRKIDAQGNVTTFAGSGASGNVDAQGEAASFYYPFGMDVDDVGNVYVTDTYYRSIRKIDVLGNVSTVANGSADLNDESTFNVPYGISLDVDGNVYVADTFNHVIRKIDAEGNVSVLAGQIGDSGDIDGEALQSLFYNPISVATDIDNNVFVVDSNNYKVRKITPSWQLVGQTSINGEHNISLVVSDGTNEVSQEFTLTVEAVNDAPVLELNLPLAVLENEQAVISSTLLSVSDEDNTASDITYALSQLPRYGELYLDGDDNGSLTASELLSLSDSFSQADINNGQLYYLQDGSESLSDEFEFSAIDNDVYDTAPIDAQLFTINITPVNDSANLSGDIHRYISEDSDDVTGQLIINDVDGSAEEVFIAQNSTVNTDGYGAFTLNTNGSWFYALDNINNTVQALAGGVMLTESFVVSSVDGTEQTITVTVIGVNGAAVITGTTSGTLTEDDTSAIVGKLSVVDEDSGEAVFIAQNVATNDDGYGAFNIDVEGAWSYELDGGNDSVQALISGANLTDGFVVSTLDGTTETVTITIQGVDGEATIIGSTTGTLTEDELTEITGTLTVVNEDDSDRRFIAQAETINASGYGTFTLDLDGAWTYTVDTSNSILQALVDEESLTDSFVVSSEAGTTEIITITILGVNAKGQITGTVVGTLTEDEQSPLTGILTVLDEDLGEAFFIEQINSTRSDAYGEFSIDVIGAWNYQLDNNNSNVQALASGESLTEYFIVSSVDGTTETVTITISGVNDSAVISGTSTGVVAEDITSQASGELSVSDVDSNEAVFIAQTQVSNDNNYGHFTISDNGIWLYELDSSNSAVQLLSGSATLTERFIASTIDGTLQTITITITGTNGVASISGDNAGELTEDGQTTVTGELTVIDEDSGEALFDAQTAVDSRYGYGAFSIDANGNWYYELDGSNATVQALALDATLTDEFVVNSIDGTEQTIAVVITGVNDEATITGTTTGTLTEDELLSITGKLTVVDEDSGESVFITQTSVENNNAYGEFSIDVDGNWSYTLDNSHSDIQTLAQGASLTDSFVVSSADGTTQTVTLTIIGVNGLATITGTINGTLTEDDVSAITGNIKAVNEDTGDSSFNAQVDTSNSEDYGVFNLAADGDWTYALNSSNTSVQGLIDGESLTDSFVVNSAEGTTETVSITITGVNARATISGTTSATISEDATSTISETLEIVDEDFGQAIFIEQLSVTSNNGYGTFNLDIHGAWRYEVDSENDTVQALIDDATLVERFIVESADGSSETITITIVGVNDSATISGTTEGSLTEDGTSTVSGSLTITDQDTGESSFIVQDAIQGSYGEFSLDAQGQWSYLINTNDASVQLLAVGEQLTESFAAQSIDGSSSENIIITLLGTNDAPIITGNAVASVLENQAYSFVPSVTDVDVNNTLVFSITAQPSWADFNTETGELSGFPSETTAGTYSNIIISVFDGVETVSLPAFDLVVVNDPTGDSDQDGVADEDDPFPNDPTNSQEVKVAPSISYSLMQNSQLVSVVNSELGESTLTVHIDDPNVLNTHTTTWNVGNTPLLALNNDDTDTTFEFDASLLDDGSYTLKVTVTESNTSEQYFVSAEIVIVVESSFTTLSSSNDSDNDGQADADEGFADSDQDGIADYLDSETSLQYLPLGLNTRPMQTTSGLMLSLGDVVRSAENVTAKDAAIDISTIANYGGENGSEVDNGIDENYDFVSDIVNFNVSGLENAGEVITVVIPLSRGLSIPENAVYRKYGQEDGWFSFVVDNNNTIYSAIKGSLGNCPAPQSSAYRVGLNVDDECIQLAIKDGGPNDSDGLENGIVKDPGVLAVLFPNNLPIIELGANTEVDEGNDVTLDASNTIDIDNDPLTYSWQQLSGPSVTLDESENAELLFTAPEVDSTQTLTFQVTVFDGTDSVNATTSVTVNDIPVVVTPAPTTPTTTSKKSSGGAMYWLFITLIFIALGRRNFANASISDKCL